MIVLDASAALDGLLDAMNHTHIAAMLTGVSESLAAPDLIDVEILSVLRRWERRRDITGLRARQALDDLQTLPVVRYPAQALLERAWQLRHNLSAYDAQYVALAQALDAKLMTTDERMAEAGRAVGVLVS